MAIDQGVTLNGKPVTEEELNNLIYSVLDDGGRELHNPIPKAEIIEGLRPLTLQEQIKRCMAIEINRRAAKENFETVQESMDFEVDDEDPEPISDYEVHEMKDEFPINNNSLPETSNKDELPINDKSLSETSNKEVKNVESKPSDESSKDGVSDGTKKGAS